MNIAAWMNVVPWLGAGGIIAWLNFTTFRRARRAEREFPPAGEFLVVKGVRLHYVERGSGPTVVLLHGSDGCIQDFGDLPERLSSHYRVIALARPGHGWSEVPPGRSNGPETQMELVRAALKRLGAGRALLVGHSWSGVLLAAMGVQHPEEVAGIVPLAATLYAPQRFRFSVAAAVTSLLLFVPRLPLIGLPLVSTFTPLVKGYILRWSLGEAFAPDSVPPDYARLAHSVWLRWPSMVRAFAGENTQDSALLRSLADRYANLHVPVVIVAGTRDRVVSAEEHACRFHKEVHGSELILLPNASHELPLAAPDDVITAIDRCADMARARGLLSESAPASEADRARELVLRYGWNVTAYQILLPEMEHWFTPDGDAVVGFVRRYGVRVAVGAPICEESRLAEVAAAFEADAERENEKVCWFAAGDRLEAALRADGRSHSAIVIGAQPAWQPENWSRIVEKTSSLRSQVNRARNKGVSIEEWEPERVAQDAALQRCQEEWLASRGLPVLRFLTAPVPLDALGDRRTFVATLEGSPVGYLVATPVPLRNGWLIEQIVRGRNAPNGASEMLVDHAMRALAASGAEYVSLGLAPLSRRVQPDADDRGLPLVRLLFRWARAHGTRFYNFEGLDAFKAKFRPDRWEPIYAVANEPHIRLKTLYAIAAAFSSGPPIAALARALGAAVRQELTWLTKREQK